MAAKTKPASKATKATKKKGTWGGFRPGAGRKPLDTKRPNVPHRARPPHDPKQPLHGSIRRAKGLPSLRTARVFETLLRCASEYAEGKDFRVLHLGADADRVHVIVEASSRVALRRGMQGLAIRLARNVNLVLARQGELWDDRFLHHPLATARAMREALDASFPPDHAAAIGSPTTAIAQRGWRDYVNA
jgi:putative transposase